MKNYLLILLFLLVYSAGLSAQQDNILIFHTYSPEVPWVNSFNEGVSNSEYYNPITMNLFFEFMGNNYPEASLTEDDWHFYLHLKYPPDMFSFILVDAPEAVSLFINHPDLFPETPKIYRSIQISDKKTDAELYLSSDITAAVRKTIEHVHQQNPDAGNAVIIDADDLTSQVIIKTASPLLKTIYGTEPRLMKVSTLDNLISEISKISPDSVVYYILVSEDDNGSGYIPRDVLKMICDVSPVPVYTFWSTLMGAGTVGGYMIDAETSAAEMFRAGVDYLKTGCFGEGYNSYRLFLDSSVLERYGMDDKHGEYNDAVFLNHPVPFLVANLETIKIVVLVSFIILFLIILMVLNILWQLNRKLKNEHEGLISLVHEKSVLIREIDHRVKNNLNILESLISMQIAEAEDPGLKNNLQDVVSRISVMTMVHEKLYQSEIDNRLDSRNYISDLIDKLSAMLIPESGKITITKDIISKTLDVQIMISLGLIINEMITNAVKYAFDPDRSGAINIILSRYTEIEYILIVNDNGRGLPAGFSIENSGGLGVKVIKVLAQQLKGRLEFENKNGASFSVIFPA